VLLAADIGFAGLALSGKRVERLFQPLLGGFASVDRTALAVRFTPRHRWPRSPRLLGSVQDRTRLLPVGSVSARRTVAPTTPCRSSFARSPTANGNACPATRSRHRGPRPHSVDRATRASAGYRTEAAGGGVFWPPRFASAPWRSGAV